MTPEEIAAKIAELEAKASRLDALEAKNKELEERVAPKAPDPDEQYKPKSWKDNRDQTERIAEEKALKIVQEAEEKREAARKKEEEKVAEQNRKIDEAFEKLEKEGLIEASSSKDDAGGRQRAQVLGSLVRSGGMNVEAETRKLKTAWDAGLEYDFDSNSYVRPGSRPSESRSAFMASSAGAAPAPRKDGPIDVRGLRGNLEEAQRRFEASRGKA